MLTPAQVRNHQFSASGRGTYRASEVDDFFASVCESYEQMFRENGELLKKIGLLADKVEEYKSDEDNIREALLTAQRMANKIVSDAKEEAEKKLSEAEQKAQQLTTESQQKADDTITSAQKTAEALVADSRKNADEIVADAQRRADERISSIKRSVTHETLVLEMTKREVSEFRASLVAMYKNHIELINKIPYIVEGEKEQENSGETADVAADAAAEQVPEPVASEEQPQEEDRLKKAFADSETEDAQEADAPYTAQSEPQMTESEAEVQETVQTPQVGDSVVSPESGFTVKFDDDGVYSDNSVSESEFEADDADDDDDEYETITPESSDKDDYGEDPISFRNLFKRK